MLRLCICLMAGILVGYFVEPDIPAGAIRFTLLFLVLFFIILWVVFRIGSAMSLLFVFVAGIGAVRLGSERSHELHFRDRLEKADAWQGVILDEPIRVRDRIRCLVRITALRIGQRWQRSGGRAMIYVQTHEVPSSFVVDALFVSRKKPVLWQNHNSYYDRYLRLQEVEHTAYLRLSELVIVPSNNYSVRSLASSWRREVEQVINRYIPEPQSNTIALALVLGISGNIDPETRQAYAVTGTLHVLAVSGLHVALLYGILLFFLRPIARLRSGAIVAFVIAQFLIWLYAMMTGLSPSVLRAVVMFTFLAVGKLINRPINTINILAASAFFLLLYSPLTIFSLGFQLSYLAVLGILLFEAPLAAIWQPATRLGSWLWRMTTVSVSAQLTTLPLTMHLFGQFPVLFVVANWIMVPASSVILIACLAMIGISWWPTGAHFLGSMISSAIGWMNHLLIWIGSLPFSSIQSLQLNAWQCIGLYLMLFTVYLLFKYRIFYMVVLIPCLAVCVTLSGDEAAVARSIRRINEVPCMRSTSNWGWLAARDGTWGILKGRPDSIPRVHVRGVILSREAEACLSLVRSNITFDVLVLDESYPKATCRRILQEVGDTYRIHAVPIHGPYKLSWYGTD